jgi:hypothetical protein
MGNQEIKDLTIKEDKKNYIGESKNFEKTLENIKINLKYTKTFNLKNEKLYLLESNKLKKLFSTILKDTEIQSLNLQKNQLYDFSNEQWIAILEEISKSNLNSLDLKNNYLKFTIISPKWNIISEYLYKSNITTIDITCNQLNEYTIYQWGVFIESFSKSKIVSFNEMLLQLHFDLSSKFELENYIPLSNSINYMLNNVSYQNVDIFEMYDLVFKYLSTTRISFFRFYNIDLEDKVSIYVLDQIQKISTLTSVSFQKKINLDFNEKKDIEIWDRFLTIISKSIIISIVFI